MYEMMLMYRTMGSLSYGVSKVRYNTSTCPSDPDPSSLQVYHGMNN
jgi:hypothetical protein